MASQTLIQSMRDYQAYEKANGITEELINAYVGAATVAFAENDREYGLEICAMAKDKIEAFVQNVSKCGFWELEEWAQDNGQAFALIDQYYELLKMESYDVFESFIHFMERKRNWRKRFYQPRRCTLHIVADDLQTLEDSKILRFQGISQPSRTGKSTICIFFLSWIAMKRPNSHSAMGGHSGILAKGFYKELLNLITGEEYGFKELFFHWHPQYKDKSFPTDKSAEDFTITLGDADRFATITCRGIDGTWTGAIDVSADGYLYVDDLVRDREHSLSPARMESTFQEYLNKMVDRKNDGAKELMVGTLWNVLDPLERLRLLYKNNSAYRFRKIPALNSKDESNFAYKISGFSTQYYREMRERLDQAEWMAKFQQQPFVREGLLFPNEEMRFFDGLLPDGEHRVFAVCDPAFGGADSLSMPIIYNYGPKSNKVVAWVHRRGTQAVTVPEVVRKIGKFGVTELHIEQNSGGKLITDTIKAELGRQDVRHCRIIPYYASTKMPKAEKIKGYSDFVKENFEFLLPGMDRDLPERIVRDEDYQKAMDEMHMYTSEGKNAHDDAPDVITQAAIIQNKKPRQVKIIEGIL